MSDPAYYVDGDPAKGMKAFWESAENRWREFSSDTSQYTYPVHYVDNSMPLVTVSYSGVLSHVKDDGRNLVGGEYIVADDGDGDEDWTDRRRRGTGTYQIHLDINEQYAIPSGSDRQFIFINTNTGEELGGWHAEDVDGDGLWEPWDGERLENGYVYNLNWTGYPPVHPSNNNYQFLSRGAGVPYGAGLIRRCEIERGRIDHVIAFAHSRNHDTAFVFPATKTDGQKIPDEPDDVLGDVLPEGQLVQLDPSISEETIQSWGCTGACLVVAKALQEYGMRSVDNSGSFKIIAEYESTAHWSSLPDDLQVIRQTVESIPVQYFRPIVNPLPLNTQIPGLHDYGFGPGGDDIEGDYNGSGLVEQADLDLVLANWGRSEVPSNWTNDLPEGVIDEGALAGVLTNWGNTYAQAPVLSTPAVPEPAGFVLALIFLSLLAVRSRIGVRLAWELPAEVV
jgi:hypothetical protein